MYAEASFISGDDDKEETIKERLRRLPRTDQPAWLIIIMKKGLIY
jgi:hypothetical protein